MMRVLDAELPMLNLVSTACSLAPDVRFLRGQPLRFFFPLACCRGTVQGRHPYLKPLRPAVGFFLFFSFFNWSVIALQCCVSFCYITTCISHMYRYIPSLLDLPPTSPPSHPSMSSENTELSSLSYTAAFH